jgi:hypothetical protein
MKRTLKVVHTKNINDKKVRVEFGLSYHTGNSDAYFFATADIFKKSKNGRFVWDRGGSLHHDILRYFKEYKPFVKLHLFNEDDLRPSHAIENGAYFLSLAHGREEFHKDYYKQPKSEEIKEAIHKNLGYCVKHFSMDETAILENLKNIKIKEIEKVSEELPEMLDFEKIGIKNTGLKHSLSMAYKNALTAIRANEGFEEAKAFKAANVDSFKQLAQTLWDKNEAERQELKKEAMRILAELNAAESGTIIE